MEEIIVTLLYTGEEIALRTYEGEYRSLMMLILDRIYIEDFAECRGMGRCGTCLVELTGAGKELLVRDRNENTTLTKMGITDPTNRLSCQILVNEALRSCKVLLP